MGKVLGSTVLMYYTERPERPVFHQTTRIYRPFCYPVALEGAGLTGEWNLAPCPVRGGEKLVWAESTIGNWIVITRLASEHHWGP